MIPGENPIIRKIANEIKEEYGSTWFFNDPADPNRAYHLVEGVVKRYDNIRTQGAMADED